MGILLGLAPASRRGATLDVVFHFVATSVSRRYTSVVSLSVSAEHCSVDFEPFTALRTV